LEVSRQLVNDQYSYEITKLYERYEKVFCSSSQPISYIRTISYFRMGLMRLEIHKLVQCRLPRSRLQSLANLTVRKFGRRLRARELSLVLTGTSAVQRLNRIYRNKNLPTDVLSFDYGEIVICYPLAKKQAREHGVSAADEISLLFVHGLLHIMGFDHHRPRERQRMRLAEKKLLGYSGLVGRNSG